MKSHLTDVIKNLRNAVGTNVIWASVIRTKTNNFAIKFKDHRKDVIWGLGIRTNVISEKLIIKCRESENVIARNAVLSKVEAPPFSSEVHFDPSEENFLFPVESQ